MDQIRQPREIKSLKNTFEFEDLSPRPHSKTFKKN